MNPAFNIPPEEEVRKAYQIPAGQPLQIESVEKLPDPNWVKKMGGYLTEAASYFGVPTFLLKTGGVIIAVFFLPYWGPKVQEEVKGAIMISYDYWVGPFQNLPDQRPEEPATNYAIVTTAPNTVSQGLQFYQTGYLQAGTSLYPISGARV